MSDSTVPVSTGSPVTCEVCELAMKYLDSMLQDNKTKVHTLTGSITGYMSC